MTSASFLEMHRLLVLAAVLAGCSGGDDLSENATPVDDTGAVLLEDTATTPTDTNVEPTDTAIAADSADTAPPTPMINVDYTSPQRYSITFKANEADTAAKQSLGTQAGYLDTRAKAKGKLVVYLHGAGSSAPSSCTQGELANVLTPMGFHVLTPCYNSYYGVGNCGTDIGGCRLEAFEGVDHTTAIDVKPADAIEPRIVAALKFLQMRNPAGDWKYFLDGDKPRYSDIIVSGISHGASSAALIGVYRNVDRVVSLSGPLDTRQAWLSKAPLTPLDRFYGFTHTGDSQHAGHLEAFATLKFPGAVTSVDGAMPPYGSSHRLKTSAATSDGHSSTQPGGSSPKSGGVYVFMPVWKYLYGG